MLRIVMVLSFVGAIVFVGFAVVTNQGIAYESYNYITIKYAETEFDEFGTDVRANVKLVYGAARDEYTEFIADAIFELNDGADYLLDYLALEGDLPKGEHNALTGTFNNYLLKFQQAKILYTEYMSAYDKAVETGGASYASNLVISAEKKFCDAYVDCYRAGSVFFKTFANTVRKYSFEGGALPYGCQSYAIKVGLCDYVISQVFTPTRGVIGTNSLKIIFENYCLNSDRYGDDDIILSNDFKRFISTLNSLNVYEWAGNFEVYVEKISNKTDATWANAFFNAGRF